MTTFVKIIGVASEKCFSLYMGIFLTLPLLHWNRNYSSFNIFIRRGFSVRFQGGKNQEPKNVELAMEMEDCINNEKIAKREDSRKCLLILFLVSDGSLKKVDYSGITEITVRELKILYQHTGAALAFDG
ncbi:hypothetical protein HNO89_002010 [Sporosarcina luteola]|nr:hypothetical protein [Sporosarcina luteola]